MNNFNEFKLLKLKHQYCLANKLDMLVIDNMSTDG